MVLISQLVILYELLQNKTVQLQVFCVMNYKCVEVAFDKINKDAERAKIVNISIAAFTMCWERLRLYHHLDTMNLNALYSDTDSVVYKWWLGQPEIHLGNFLGAVTDELVSGGRMCDHIVNSSPVVLKTMGTGPRAVGVTVHGFTLNIWGSEVLHFESMKCTVQAEVLNAQKEQQTITLPNPTFIRRNPATKALTTIRQDKTWGMIFDKSVVED